MTPVPALSLLDGWTTHVRYEPFERRFAYRLFLIDLDIDRLDEADRMTPLFRVDRPGLFGFRRRDHGACEPAPLRPWAEARFADAGVDLQGGTIRLVTLPRHLFYKFAPLSVWLGHGPDGDLRGVVYEVRNTFGDRHSYVAATSPRGGVHDAEKRFHVSPFFDVSGRYGFRLAPSPERFDLVVDSLDTDGRRLHMANIKTRRQPATTAALLRTTLVRPAMSWGVTLGIHWEALKLWAKGARYRSRPQPPQPGVTLAHGTDSAARRQGFEDAS